ncbi:MAG: CoB--CoM heterodisulfide reductase subunit B 2 [Promethearchaeota archaeon]|nr:MAG: CoB--CoM heterodisulfide reductase subunit B 2 [Candidatus Lokiarchaeota archaeon]
MSDAYALFLGCTIPLKFPHFEKAFREISALLDITYKEMEGASCCPDPVATQSLNVDTWLTLAARNLAIAEKMDLDIMTVCSGCYETLKTTRVLLEEDKDAFGRVNSVLNQINYKYKGTSDVFHFVELFVQDEMLEKIREKIVTPLDNLNIAAHYGCHLIRPSNILQFDDPERPESMDKILNILGANTVAFASKLECCGYCARLNEDIGFKLVEEKMIDLTRLDNEVDVMVAVCPACVSQYDRKERLLQRNTEEDLNIPILYLPELMALAFGVDQTKLDLSRRSVKPKKLLEKLKI